MHSVHGAFALAVPRLDARGHQPGREGISRCAGLTGTRELRFRHPFLGRWAWGSRERDGDVALSLISFSDAHVDGSDDANCVRMRVPDYGHWAGRQIDHKLSLARLPSLSLGRPRRKKVASEAVQWAGSMPFSARLKMMVALRSPN